MKKLTIAFAAAASLFAMTGAKAQGGLEAGTLDCTIAPKFGYVLFSSREIACEFIPVSGPRRERYVGTISRVGGDIGISYTRQIWFVMAPTKTLGRGALAGNYGGVSADVAVGPGLGLAAMLGNSANTIQLQPVSFQGKAGLSIGAGITGLTLTKV